MSVEELDVLFLLTPLREGRPENEKGEDSMRTISTHAPAGGATRAGVSRREVQVRISTHAPAGGATGYGRRRVRTNTKFLLTPLREGRLYPVPSFSVASYFYSRPCGRGDAES